MDLYFQQKQRHFVSSDKSSKEKVAPASGSLPIWLQSVIKSGRQQGGNVHGGVIAGVQGRPSSEMSSDTDTGRTQMRLQQLLRVANEQKLIQNSFSVGAP